jgi:molybdate transport system permease protein
LTENRQPEEIQPISGPRMTALNVVSLGFLALFVIWIGSLIYADLSYLHRNNLSLGTVWEILGAPDVLSSIRLSLFSSLVTLGLVIFFSVPIGYALSRHRFPGHSVVNTMVEVPIVLPPVVIGVSLLAFFATPFGEFLKDALKWGGWSLTSAIGIVLCQFLMAVPYAIRMNKASFDSADRRLEHVAMSLGCTQWQAFRRVTLPLARNGLIAGSVLAWARAIGVFGPLMVFVGTSPRVMVMPTKIWLELSIGKVEVSLAVAMIMLLIAGVALVVVHRLTPGRTWR